jgi:hypothetical protein
MRAALLVLLLAILPWQAEAQFQNNCAGISAFCEPPAGASYIGPGDVVAGATGYYGFRGYSGAFSTGSNNAVTYRRASDNTTQNGVILTSGAFDIATALAFSGTDAVCTGTIASTTLTVTSCASGTLHVNDQISGTGITNPTTITVINTCGTPPGTCTISNAATVSVAEPITATVALFVTELFDQTGNGRHVLQATAANQPQLLASCVGALPCMSCSGSSQGLIAGSTFTPTTGVMTFSAVAERTGNLTTQSTIIGVTGASGNNLLGGNSVANNWRVRGSSAVTRAATDSAINSAQGVINGASPNSMLYINGTATNGSAGSSTTAEAPSVCENVAAGTAAFAGFFMTGAWWDALAFSATQAANMSSNDNGYW